MGSLDLFYMKLCIGFMLVAGVLGGICGWQHQRLQEWEQVSAECTKHEPPHSQTPQALCDAYVNQRNRAADLQWSLTKCIGIPRGR